MSGGHFLPWDRKLFICVVRRIGDVCLVVLMLLVFAMAVDGGALFVVVIMPRSKRVRWIEVSVWRIRQCLLALLVGRRATFVVDASG